MVLEELLELEAQLKRKVAEEEVSILELAEEEAVEEIMALLI